MIEPVLDVDDLHVTYPADGPAVRALRGVSLMIGRAGSVAVVGESGCGKTTLGLSTLKLLPPGTDMKGRVVAGGQDVVTAPPDTVRRLRWGTVACVIQAPGRGLNPVKTVGKQVAEPLRAHLDMSASDARGRAAELAALVGLDPSLLDRYPHQLSGGQAQRAMLAMALTCDPDLLVLDEPTSGLDASTRAALVETLSGLREQAGLALLLLTHDLAAAADLADEVAVLYAGMIMERGGTRRVLEDPRHPYTRDLVGAYPTMTTQKDLRGIRGTAPDPSDPPGGCPYHPRCTQAIEECATWSPEFEPVAGRDVLCVRGGLVTRLTARDISVTFRLRGGRGVEALRDVDIDVREGEVVGLVGQTGSGKSTLARVLLGLIEPDTGTVHWEGRALATLDAGERVRFRRRTALIHQDPFEATSPRMTVGAVVREPLDVQRPDTDADQRVREVLAAVGLPTTDAFLRRNAHQLSGGQLQRVAVARALVLGPRLLIADEPTSMLDASEQAKLMVLLKDLQVTRGMAMVLLSHDLPLVRKAADRIVVLHDGEVVEEGPGARIVAAPTHPATRALVDASPHLTLSGRATAAGETTTAEETP